MSLATASAWIQANPVLFTLIIWPAVTGLITAIARKRTAEEYAAMPPRLAAVLRFIGAVGLDLPKMLQTARLVITGGVPADAPADVRPTGKLPQDPPSGPGVGLMVLVLAFGLRAQGCGSPRTVPPNAIAGACVTSRLAASLECERLTTRPDVEACQATARAAHECVTDGGIQ